MRALSQPVFEKIINYLPKKSCFFINLIENGDGPDNRIAGSENYLQIGNGRQAGRQAYGLMIIDPVNQNQISSPLESMPS